MDKYLKITDLEEQCTMCGSQLDTSHIIPDYINSKLVFLVKILSHDAAWLYINNIKNAAKRASIHILETLNQCVILASNQNLTEEIYNTLKLNIEAIPKSEFEIVIDFTQS